MLSSRTVNRLQDVVDNACRIESFIANERTIIAVERLLQRITEAVLQIGPDDAARIGLSLLIAQMRALGNRLRHEYRDIDRTIVFDLARVEVPSLVLAVELILDTFGRDG